MALVHTRVFAQHTATLPTQETPYKAYIETYGCQMNFADSELVAGILHSEGYAFVPSPQEADL
ncbi:MAG: tRNA (N6-isopentenyl adenosine(37)-C2)-methylthiotransferase MiaB, partial [Bacteroidia bacterium]|nr:tRNA (N6-isopentenyl adenosine(37)-C2)-methylthiotransferase MiaB [Bacteroidia bacterium]